MDVSLSPAMKRLLYAIYGNAPAPLSQQIVIEELALPRDDCYAIIRTAIESGYIAISGIGYVMLMKGLDVLGVTGNLEEEFALQPVDPAIEARELDDALDSVLRRLSAPEIIPAATVRVWKRLYPSLPMPLQEVLMPLNKIVETGA